MKTTLLHLIATTALLLFAITVTADKAKDKMIAERLFPGYEWDGRVIRPEMVNVYLYVEDSQDINFRSTDE